MTLDPDGADMREVQAGRLDRFSRLVARHQSGLYRYAQSILGSSSTAEDAVQETFLSAFKNRATYDPNRPFRGWLWTIHVNNCRRIARQNAGPLVAAGVQQFEALPCREMPADHGLQQAEEQRLLQETMALLPEEQADAIRMRFFGNLSFEEIGEAMDCSAATAKSRVRYGLAKMAKHLKSGREICS